MADYGIEDFTNERMLYIREHNCGVSVRVNKNVSERTIYETFWDVELSSDGENWQTIYTLKDEEQALKARDRLAEFIDEEAIEVQK